MHLHDIWAGRPLPFVFPYWIVFWGLWAWAFQPEYVIVREARRRMAADPASVDAGSMRVILLGMQLAWLGSLPLAWVRAFRPPAAYYPAWFVAGALLLIAGSLLRRHCWKVLGASFTGDVRARADQRIVTDGAYARLRHPSYTGGMLMWLGIGVALGSWASTLLLVVASFVSYSYRIAVEERALLAAVGEPYRAFCAARKRIIPFVY